MTKFGYVVIVLMSAAFAGVAHSDENWPFVSIVCSKDLDYFSMRTSRKWGPELPWSDQAAQRIEVESSVYGLSRLSKRKYKCSLPNHIVTVKATIKKHDAQKQCGAWLLGDYIVDIAKIDGSANLRWVISSGDCRDDRSQLFDVSGSVVTNCVIDGTGIYGAPAGESGQGCTTADLPR